MIRLIALDLDGTILDDSLAISAATMAILRRVQADHDVRVVIATGRMFPSTLPFARRLGLHDPVVAYQGAMIRDIHNPVIAPADHPILFHCPIDPAVARQIVTMIHDHDYHANVYVSDQLFTNRLNLQSDYYQKISGVVPQEARDFHPILTAGPSKIMIIDNRAEAILASFRQTFGGDISMAQSRHNYCEIVHGSVSKWTALTRLMADWEIPASAVMAIGDQENDLSMIRGAGVGVAMGNAPEHVQSAADVVTDSVEHDGAAHAIARFVYHQPLSAVLREGMA